MTVAEAFPAAAVPIVGTPGTVTAEAAGVTALEAAEKAPVPTPLTAATWNRTAVPLVRPDTTRLVAPAPADCNAPICTVPAELSTFTE